MSMTESLQANLPSFLRSASVADIALVLEATSIELRKRALPGSVQLDTSAHVLRLYVSAFTSARVAIHGDDCRPPLFGHRFDCSVDACYCPPPFNTADL